MRTLPHPTRSQTDGLLRLELRNEHLSGSGARRPGVAGFKRHALLHPCLTVQVRR